MFRADYWVRVGCKDQFALLGFREHQRCYIQQGSFDTRLYPPFLSALGEWCRWFLGNNLDTRIAEVVGRLPVKVVNDWALGRFGAVDELYQELLKLNVTILGLDGACEVRTDENRGRAETQGFNVRAFGDHD